MRNSSVYSSPSRGGFTCDSYPAASSARERSPISRCISLQSARIRSNSGAPAPRNSGSNASTKTILSSIAEASSSANESRNVIPSRSQLGRCISKSDRSCVIRLSGTGVVPTIDFESTARVARIVARSSCRFTLPFFSRGIIDTGTCSVAASSKS